MRVVQHDFQESGNHSRGGYCGRAAGRGYTRFVQTIPIALERLPHAYAAHAIVRFEQRNGVGKPVGETLAIRAKVDQGFLCAIRVGPTVIDKHPGNGTCLAWNSSILLTIACSLTSRPNESQVHHPNPVSASGNGAPYGCEYPAGVLPFVWQLEWPYTGRMRKRYMRQCHIESCDQPGWKTARAAKPCHQILLRAAH